MRSLLVVVVTVLALTGCHGSDKESAKASPAIVTWPEAREIAIGEAHACAVASSGEIRCFGGSNLFGQTGKGVALRAEQGKAAKGLPDHPLELVAGANDTCGLYAGGVVKCIGTKELIVGRNAYNDPADPIAHLSPSNDGLCGVRASGKVVCWGNGATGDRHVDIIDLPPAATISAGFRRACVVTRDSDAICFGWPRADHDPKAKIEVEKIASNVAEVATTGAVTCIIGKDRRLSCLGRDNRGLLGKVNESATLVPIADDAESLTLGTHGCFLRSGAAYCWGWNSYGQVGDGTLVNQQVPQKVQSNETFVSVLAREQRTCARTTKGQLLCWGVREAADMGSGGAVAKFAPITISDL